ncbi:hypothetical protein [Micromonospora andamanensis]|uniref:hypothetical protein n=1 Tax=Micromonospora andamanensis TaxID=1287068 RepID=UPI001EF25A25|nr:hypothetical protein [Micromonospora andamanensis]
MTSEVIPGRATARPVPLLGWEVSMRWNNWIRQIHRWLAIAFTVTVIVTFVALGQDNPVEWVAYLPLLPLALLLFTGLYLFVLPYVVKRRGGRATAGAS